MGGVASAIECAVCSVASAVGCAVDTVACTVGDVVQSAINNPIQTLADVAAVATGNPELIPLINGGMTLATTGCISKALEKGAIGAVTQGLSSGICLPCSPCIPTCLPSGGLPSGCTPSTCLPSGCTPSTCFPSGCAPTCGAVCSGFYCNNPVNCLPGSCLPSGCVPSGCVPTGCYGCTICTPCDRCSISCDLCTPCNTCTPCDICSSCNARTFDCYAPIYCRIACDCLTCCCDCNCCECCTTCCDPNLKHLKKPKLLFKIPKGAKGKKPKVPKVPSGCCSCDTCLINPVKHAKSALSVLNSRTPSLGSVGGGKSGVAGKSANTAGATCQNSRGSNMPTSLCGSESFINAGSGSGYKGDLRKVAGASILSPLGKCSILIPDACCNQQGCMYQLQCRANVLGQCTCRGLSYACGGSTDCAEEKKKEQYGDALKTWKESFCEKNLTPKFVCDKPEFLSNTGQLTNSDLSPLKHIYQSIASGYAKGGLPGKYQAAAPKGHKPEFITGVTGYYACGGGTGQSDDIPAMLHDGDYVMDAETVSALGDGSSKAGMHVLESFRKQVPHKAEGGSNPVPAKIADGEYVFPASFVTALGGGDNRKGAEILDGLRTKLRAQKRSTPLDKIPSKAKAPIDYIKKGSK